MTVDGAVHPLLAFDAASVFRLLPPAGAVQALRDAVVAGASESDAPRTMLPEPDGAGTLAVMPAVDARWLGIKVLSIRAATTSQRDAIVGTYLVVDPATGALHATIDGTALTALRTSAVSALALTRLAAPTASRVLVIGTGTQARAHLHTLMGLGRFSEFTVVGRDRRKAEALAEEFPDGSVQVGELEPAIRQADVIACCTSARTPLFDGALVSSGAAIAAMGTYQLTHRELDDTIISRASIYVETLETALTEAGDIHQAIDSGVLRPDELRTLAQLFAPGEQIDFTRPRVFKSCGMSWEDLAVAAEILRRHEQGEHAES
ncbi:ornithine cyclodeaminase family protein [Microbacterium sp.]|uniref:ornithine cyclodeaminase family protein n=1 Tax=Microbacterium sp. TaxID=51671 RepID=UPI0039E687E8